jgi:hypothetical protein
MYRPRYLSLYQPGGVYDQLPEKVYGGILAEQSFHISLRLQVFKLEAIYRCILLQSPLAGKRMSCPSLDCEPTSTF